MLDASTTPHVIETLTFRAGFNTNLVMAGTTLLGLAAGIVGVFALLRKRSMTADALSHATLPGIAGAFLVTGWLGMDGRSLPVLLLGATVTGVLGVVSIQAILRYSRLREDAAIGIVLSVFFGVGIVGLSYIQANAPDGSAGIDGFIYGQAAAMQPSDLWLLAGIAVAALVSAVLLLKEFALVCFNDAFARVDGWPVTVIDLLMMAMIVLVTVAGLQSVGLIMVVALLILPAVSARFWSERLWRVIVIAGVIGALSGYFGSVVSSMLPRKPAGAVIVLTSGVFFVVSLLAAPSRGLVAASWRRMRLRLRIAGDHLLELAHDSEVDTLTGPDIDRVAHTRGWSRPFRWAVLRALRAGGMVSGLRDQPGPTLALTPAGTERGARVARNHALWKQYLVSHADVAPSHVDWSVDQVEHVLGDDLIRALESELAQRGIDVGPSAEAHR